MTHPILYGFASTGVGVAATSRGVGVAATGGGVGVAAGLHPVISRQTTSDSVANVPSTLLYFLHIFFLLLISFQVTLLAYNIYNNIPYTFPLSAR
jgi:hypothetical protein